MEAIRTLAVTAALLASVAGANAGLVDRGGGMIYDSTRNITWLADMNYSKSQYSASGGAQGDADGLMTWTAAKDWANALVYGGYSDWRLPTLNPADTTCSDIFNPGGVFPNQYFGYGCTGGELSGLFVTDLGNKARESVLNQVGDTAEQIANLALLSNVQSNGYWSGTKYAPSPDLGWYFGSFDGGQYIGVSDKSFALYAVAVRDGNVTVAVAEPQSLALAIAALAAGSLVRRRTQRFAPSRPGIPLFRE